MKAWSFHLNSLAMREKGRKRERETADRTLTFQAAISKNHFFGSAPSGELNAQRLQLASSNDSNPVVVF
jgi:hypothetical protein